MLRSISTGDEVDAGRAHDLIAGVMCFAKHLSLLIPLAALLLGARESVHGEAYGMAQRAVSGAFLNGTLPPTEVSVVLPGNPSRRFFG
jgi:hypothetical protein